VFHEGTAFKFFARSTEKLAMDNRTFREILASRLADAPTESIERQKADGHSAPLFSVDLLTMKMDAFRVSAASQNPALKLGRSAYQVARTQVRPMPVETDVVTPTILTPTPTAVSVEKLSPAARLALHTLNISSTKITLKDIRRTFYRLARKLHPDAIAAGRPVVTEIHAPVAKDPTEAYLLIQDAYDLLCAEFAQL